MILAKDSVKFLSRDTADVSVRRRYMTTVSSELDKIYQQLANRVNSVSKKFLPGENLDQ